MNDAPMRLADRLRLIRTLSTQNMTAKESAMAAGVFADFLILLAERVDALEERVARETKA